MDPLTHIYDKSKAETLCGAPNASSRLRLGFIHSDADRLKIRTGYGDHTAEIHTTPQGEWLAMFNHGKFFFTLCDECYGIHIMIST